MLLHNDLVYGEHPRQRYDLYEPSLYDGAVVYLHGGGWEDGDKSWDAIRTLAFSLAETGLLVAVPNYRLVGDVSRIPQELKGDGRYPNNVEDVQLFLKHFCPQSPLCLVGESAGGHLAILSLLGLPCLPKGVVSLSAPMDLVISQNNPITAYGQQLIEAYTGENSAKASPAHRLLEYKQVLGSADTRLYFWRNAQDGLTLSNMSVGFIRWAKGLLGERVKEVVVDTWSNDNPHKVSLTLDQKTNLVLAGINFIFQREEHDISNG